MPLSNRAAHAGLAQGLAKGLALAAILTIAVPGLALAQAKKPAAPAKPAQKETEQPAQAPAAAPSGPTLVKLKPEPAQPEWTKVCGEDKVKNKQICYTTRDFVSDQGQPVLAMAVYDVKGEPTRIVRFLMPLGLLIQPGIRFGVDKEQPVEGRYALCFPNGCFAEGPVKDAEINAMKKGEFVNVSVQNQAGAVVTFQVPLTGFAKGFDGAPIDPKVLQEQQQKLQEELQKRSEELRKKLETQPGAAGAPAANAPAPAPAPAK